jgi:SAM-dependent methyltransferase
MGDQQTPNAEMIKGWDGPEGDNWTENEAFYANSSRRHTSYLFAGAAIEPSDRVLDVGCGTGTTTREAARAAKAGSVFGIDLSTRMLERAREHAKDEALDNVHLVRGDAQIYPFDPGSFNVAISRFGVMFFDDPVGAFTNIGRAIAPGGRLAFLCWRELARNEWITALRDALASGRTLPEPPPNAPGPLALADAGRVDGILSDAGFTDVVVEPVDEPLLFGPDAASTFDHLQKTGMVIALLGELDDKTRADALEKLHKTVADHETPEGVLFASSAWLVRAAKPR